MNVPACRHRWPRNDRSGRGPEAASSQRSDTATLGTLPRLARCFLLNGWTSIRVFIAMASTFVTRDQFNVTPQGVVHKPTEAGFIPHSGDPHSGTVRLGQLLNQLPNGGQYPTEHVQRMMRELWTEFVAKNLEAKK